MIIVKALYGLKSSGAAWRNLLSSSIKALEFTSSKADPDLYYHAQVKKNGKEYYEYLPVYGDGILCLSENTKPIMEEIGALCCLKENSVGPPERYLGADTKILQMKSGVQCWIMSPDSYVREAISNVELLMEQDGNRKRRPMTPFPNMNYKPELDTSQLLDAPIMSRYRQLAGIIPRALGFYDGVANWAVWISYWKCHYCLHSMQYLVKVTLMHCTISSAI